MTKKMGSPLETRSKNTYCILHDTFIYRGGAERLMIMMANILGSDIASGYFDEGSFIPEEEGFKGTKVSLGKRPKNKYLAQIILQFRFLFHTGFLRNYKTVIFSGDCLLGIFGLPKDIKKIYYCHTPPRYLFDKKEEYLYKIPLLLKPLAYIYISILTKLYIKSLEHIDVIYTNSQNTQKRILQYTNQSSLVVYPCVDTGLFVPKIGGRKDYYFSYARLSDIKRVDIIAKTFFDLPDKTLIIHHGKNDPEKERMSDLIQGYKNIHLISYEDQDNLIKAIQGAISVIYIPKDEDFGMIPIESMSCGVPVIGVNEGGIPESVCDKETGLLIDPDTTSLIAELKKAVNTMTPEYAASLKDICIKKAHDFSFEKMKIKILTF